MVMHKYSYELRLYAWLHSAPERRKWGEKMKKYSKENIQTVLKMAWPSVLESFFVALVGMVDSLMVSRVGAHAVAAVGLTTSRNLSDLPCSLR